MSETESPCRNALMTLREQPTESARLENHLMIVNALDNGSDMRDGNANDVASAYTEWAIKNAVRATLDTIDDWSLPNQWALTDPRMAEEVTKGVQTSWINVATTSVGGRGKSQRRLGERRLGVSNRSN